MNSNGSHQYGDANVADYGTMIQGNIYNNNYFEWKIGQTEEDWKLLLTSFCYTSMNDRKQQIHSARGRTCEWIWSTVFTRWLRIKKAKIFWISGKPGSGKSTLMKYLSQSSDIENKLPREPSPWIVIDFFFDFRLANQTGNSLDGLIRSLLFQLVKELPGVGSALHTDLDNTLGRSLEILETAFTTALNLSQRCVLLLIDGLDEYAGRFEPLFGFFFRIKRCQNVKLCLASRPDPVIFEILSCLPKIAMSDYNSQGIRQYVDAVVDGFQPRLDILRSPGLEDLILQRADGVFLWVHLVLDEIVEACAEGADAVELKNRLEILPTELESLYKRILIRMPKIRKPFAAMVFVLIDNAIQHVSLELLQHTLKFITCELKILREFDWADVKHFERWLHGTMRGLVDIVSEGDGRVTQTNASTIRLIHRTFRSYSKHSGWYVDVLPDEILQIDPSWIWSYICSEAILASGRSLNSSATRTICSLEGKWLSYNAFVELSEQLFTFDTITQFIALLFHSIIYLPMHAEKAALSGTTDIQNLVNDGLRSPLACIHYAITGRHCLRGVQPITIALSQGISDLMLAAAHKNIQYLKTHGTDIRNLNDAQRREIVTIMVMVSGLKSECPARYIDNDDKDAERNVIASILSYDSKVSPFHLAVYLRLGYDDMPQFLHQPIMKGQLCPSSAPQISPWACAAHLFATEAPLFIWACEYTKRSPELTCRAQLQVLAFFGLDINARSSQGQNIIHYLISRHMIGHTFLEKGNDCACFPRDDLAEATEKLYALELSGADFTEQFEHRTPLQAFRHGVDIVRRAKEIAYDIPEERFVHIDFILEHKEKKGHLPQPMLGTKFWKDIHLPLLLEEKCDICEGEVRPPSSSSLASPMNTHNLESSLTPLPKRPARPLSTPSPSPSRIPRLVKTHGGKPTLNERRISSQPTFDGEM